LSTFSFNGLGQRLYKTAGYREVGVFKNQGIDVNGDGKVALRRKNESESGKCT
jgi:ribosomal protein S18 acetylase RimI-like enzyme